MSGRSPRGDVIGAAGHPGELVDVDEDMWLDVIHKMDEVYSELLQYEVALEQKNAKLEESQQFILSVLTSIFDVLVVCDRAGRIEDVNASLEAFTGRRADELKGGSLYDLFADDASRRQARELLSHQGGRAVHDCELPLRAADGSAVPVSLNCTPRFNAVGKSLGMVVTGRPVGELRRAYQALRQAHDDLKRTQQQLLQSEQMASLGRLVAGVAHELNNPISFILGNVHALRRYADRIQRYLDAVHRGLGDEALDAMRRELRIDRILEDLEPLIDGAIEGAERTCDIVDGLKRFSAVDRDVDQTCDLAEVIDRAVRWVCRAARDDFSVVVDPPSARLEIGAEIVGGRLRLRFRDNCPGIDAQHLAQIFDPFFTTKPVGQGTGLGLAISYGIVERHGGTLHAGNAEGGGAEFVLTLPLSA